MAMRLNTILWFYLLFMEIFYFRTGYNLGGKGKWPSRENWMWRSSRGRWSWTFCQRARTRVLCPRDFLEAVCWVLLRLLGMLESAGSWNLMGSELDLDQRKDLDCCQLHLQDLPDLQGEGSTCFPDCKEIEKLRIWIYAHILTFGSFLGVWSTEFMTGTRRRPITEILMLGLALVGAEVGIPGSPIRRDLLFLVNNIPAIIAELKWRIRVDTYLRSLPWRRTRRRCKWRGRPREHWSIQSWGFSQWQN